MYRVRFHLGAGEHFMHWQVRHPDGRVTYHDPNGESLLLYGCRLRNQRKTAEKIKAGANKTVCAWVEADAVSLHPGVPAAVGGVVVEFNPRVAPYWRDSLGHDIDGHRYRCIATSGRHMKGQRVETFDCVCCGTAHENEFSLTCEACDRERESGDLQLPEEYRD
jgi:hypothetical protein